MQKIQWWKIRRKAKHIAIFVSIITLAACKAKQPETITAQVIEVQYENGNTNLYAELPDGNIEWWECNYHLNYVPREITITNDTHEIVY